jgi:hypothetical protein
VPLQLYLDPTKFSSLRYCGTGTNTAGEVQYFIRKVRKLLNLVYSNKYTSSTKFSTAVPGVDSNKSNVCKLRLLNLLFTKFASMRFIYPKSQNRKPYKDFQKKS